MFKTCSKRLEGVLRMSWIHFCKTSWRHIEDVLKTFWRHYEVVLEASWRSFLDVLKTSWRRMAKTNTLVLIKMSWIRLEDVFWRRTSSANIFVFNRLDEDVLNTSSRCLLRTKTKDFFKTTSRRLHQDECLLGSFCNNICIKLDSFNSAILFSTQSWKPYL